MGQYLPILLLLALAGLFAGLSLIASGLLNPRRETAPKISPYECGVIDQLPPPERFPVRFYLVAMIFIVFDIEIIFLYPFTMVYRELGAFGLGAVVIFGLAVFESFLYVLANGALDWGPARQLRRTNDLAVSSARTSRNTIRRVGTTGRADEPSQPHEHEAA
jgi:NADH-quinone oxidoreductase subunit A